MTPEEKRARAAEWQRNYRAANRNRFREVERQRRERRREYLEQYQEDHTEDRRQRTRKWYIDNHERALEYARAYGKRLRANNLDKAKQNNRENYAKHAEQRRQARREYTARNPERVAASNRNLRSARKRATGSHTAADVKNLFAVQHGKCATCRSSLKESGYHVDHVMPIALGGSNGPENLQLLCPPCNQKKHAMHPDEWARLNGRLFC